MASLPFRAVIHQIGFRNCLTHFLASEVALRSGLGLSSTLTVALPTATSTFLSQPMSRQELADLACLGELKKRGAPID